MPPAIQEKSAEEDAYESGASSQDFTLSEVAPRRRHSPKELLVRLFYSPLTWLAIGAHVLLLIVPFDPSARTPEVTEEQAEETVDESIPIDILNLAELATPTPPPEQPAATPPAQTATPPPVPAPAAALPAAVEEPAPLEPVGPEELLDEEPVGGDEDTGPDETEIDSTGGEESANYDPTENQNYFVGQIANLGISVFEGVVQYPAAEDFDQGNGDRFLNFADPLNPVPLPESRDAVYMDEQVSDVIATLNNAYGGSVQITQADAYADELLYALSDVEDNVFMYVSLVEFKSGSTLVVMWPNNPNGPAG